MVSVWLTLTCLYSFSQSGGYKSNTGPTAYSPLVERADVKYKAEKRKLTPKEYKKTFTYNFYKHHDDLVDQFYERLEENAKTKKKIARKMKKPQYSDPTYFGHKRKPKKRPVGKRKFCKECGMEH